MKKGVFCSDSMNKNIYRISFSFLCILFFVFLMIYFASATIIFRSPVNSTNFTGTMFFNITFINNSVGDTNITGFNWTNVNVSLYRINGASINLLGNLSTCAYTAGLASGNISCYGNISLSPAIDGVYNITAEVFGVSNATYINVTNSTLSNITNIRFDSSAPIVVVNGSNGLVSGQNVTGLVLLNISIIDNGIGVQSVFFNVTNVSGTQLNMSVNGTNSSSNNYWNATLNTTNLIEGLYNITIYTNDTLNNINNTVNISNFRVDRTAPNMSFFNNPLAGQNASGILVLNVSVTDWNSSIGAVMFNITNSTGVQNYTLFASSVGSSTNLYWNASLNTALFLDGNYNITAYVNDTVGNQNNTAVSYSVTLDNTAPTMTYSCTPSSTVERGYAMTCSCTAIDALSGVNSTSYTQNPATIDTGSYTTSCTAIDRAGNSLVKTVSYIVQVTATPSSGSSGGGGSSGSSSITGAVTSATNTQTNTDTNVPASVSWQNTYAVNSEQINSGSGYSQSLAPQERMVLPVAGETHSVGIISVGVQSAVIRIESTPQQITLAIGESKKVSVNNADYYDLQVTLNSISNGRADVNVIPIHELISDQNAIDESVNPENIGQNASQAALGWIIVLVMLVVFVVILYFRVRKPKSRVVNVKKKRKR